MDQYMARLSSEILGLSYHTDAGQVFHVICFRLYQRTTHDFRGSVFQLVKVGPITRGVSESMDGRWCAILVLEVVPKNLILA